MTNRSARSRDHSSNHNEIRTLGRLPTLQASPLPPAKTDRRDFVGVSGSHAKAVLAGRSPNGGGPGSESEARSFGSENLSSGGYTSSRGNRLAQPRHSHQVHKEFGAYYPSDQRALCPQWNKATRDPGERIGRVAGGYARRIDDTSVSANAPQFMLIPQVMSHTTKTGLGSQFRVGKGGVGMEAKKQGHGGSTIDQHRDDTSVSHDAPDWFKSKALDAFQARLDRGEVVPGYGTSGIRKLAVAGQVIFEPLRAPRVRNAGPDILTGSE